MPSASSNDLLNPNLPATRRTGHVLVLFAGAGLVLNCLLTSPSHFSEAHRKDRSWLKSVVAAMALVGPSAESGAFPTPRMVDIRNLIFHVAAALLCFVGGLRLLTSGARTRFSLDDAWNLRERAKGPWFWWAVLLLTSLLTSYFSHAPDVSLGQSALRFMQAAWWWPLAALLPACYARRLGAILTGAVMLSALVGIWYLSAREPDVAWSDLLSLRASETRLWFPIGNSLWFGACILPVVFVALGVGMDTFVKPAAAPGSDEGNASCATAPIRSACKCKWTGAFCLSAAAVLLLALILTQSRSSAWVGFCGGLLALIFVLSRKTARPAVALVGLFCALAGVWYVQGLRSSGVMGERAHSIRSRLNHEWPYAISLFMQKPVGGHGEGCYTMLAPQIARVEQLQEPAVMAFDDERWWYSHAHSEFLELLADLGVVGAAAFIAALVSTLFCALRYCDRAAQDRASRPHRLFVACLMAALFGAMLEECSSVALRQPGFPPIFMTVWALLWVLVRGERIAADPVETDANASAPSSALFRWAGLAGVAVAVGLGYLGIQDWRALLANQAALAMDTRGDLAAAQAKTDFASNHLLDPFQKLKARMQGVGLRSTAFARAVEAHHPPTEADLQSARDAIALLDRLDQAAPRFLNVSRIGAQLSLNMAKALQARGETQAAGEYANRYRISLVQASNDDPFNTALVRILWSAIPEATPMDRLFWLRRLLRRGEADEPTRAMTEFLFRRTPGSVATLNDLVLVAREDTERPTPSMWQDTLSPETLRIAAMLKDWAGQPAEAEQLARQASAMYRTLGEGVFAAHAAAMRESAFYGLHVDPMGRTDELLKVLVDAHTEKEGAMNLAGDAALRAALPNEIGATRALVLAAAGRVEELRDQLKARQGVTVGAASTPTEADVYAALAEQFGPKQKYAGPALRWALRARELNDALPSVHYTLLGLYLARGDETDAEQAARKFIELMPDREQAFELLQDCERRYRDSGLWKSIRADFAEFPELPLETGLSDSQSQPTDREGTASQRAPENSNDAATEPRDEDGANEASP